MVDGIVRGEDFGSLSSRAAALDWDPTADTLVVAGSAPPGDRAEAVAAVAEWAGVAGRAAMAGVHGDRLVLVLAGSGAARTAAIETLFGDGPVVRGRPGGGLRGGGGVGRRRAGRAGRRRAPGRPRPAPSTRTTCWPNGCWPATSGRPPGCGPRSTPRWPPRRRRCCAPWRPTWPPAARWSPTARSLFVHPNTVRYRLHRVAELTGRDPWKPRDLLVLQTAVILGRLGRTAPPEPTRG